MKTRYWKGIGDSQPLWRDDERGLWNLDNHCQSICTVGDLEADPCVIECDADGNPLDTPIESLDDLLAAFDVVCARVRAKLVVIEKEDTP